MSIDNKSLDDNKWMQMFQKLIAYKATHKNTMVPQEYKEDSKLGHWVRWQRDKYRNDDLLSSRLAYLNSIDFVWNERHNEKWDDMFQKLVAYHKLHKHTMVPTRYDEDPKLGT